MAGIGFELRKILKENSLLSILKVYGYSAVLSSGSWIISILSIVFIGIVNIYITKKYTDIVKFQVVITYLIAFSLIFTGFFQLSFTRYIADRLFEKDYKRVLPNYFGVLFITFLVGLLVFIPLSLWIFPQQSNLFRILFISSFLILCGIWLSNSLLLGLKEYKKIVSFFAIGYLIVIIFSYLIRGFGLEGYLLSFFLGNSFIFFSMVYLIVKHYESDKLFELDFLLNKKHRIYFSIAFAGVFYNLGIWIDKFIFWINPETNYNVIGKLNASIVYDLPIFLAYLSIVPGMAVFFYRLEADFAEKYDNLFNAVRTDGTFEQIITYKNDMIETIRIAIKETIITQGIFNILLYIFSENIFKVLNIPLLYLPLFYIDLVGVQLQLAFMAILAILFYIDRKRESLFLTLLFFCLNGIFSYLSIKAGYIFYGYGFALSLLISFIISLIILRRNIDDIEYETFSLQ